MPCIYDKTDTFFYLSQEHDVVFCLTDTRESRWLPTLIASATDTLLINCALGFDSYLVMRHGRFGVGDEKNIDDGDKETVPSLPETAASPEPSCPEKLGCYFCNDVMAPGNSTNDRTLDQHRRRTCGEADDDNMAATFGCYRTASNWPNTSR